MLGILPFFPAGLLIGFDGAVHDRHDLINSLLCSVGLFRCGVFDHHLLIHHQFAVGFEITLSQFSQFRVERSPYVAPPRKQRGERFRRVGVFFDVDHQAHELPYGKAEFHGGAVLLI